MSKLTALDLDRLYGQLRQRGLAPATIRQIHAVFRAALNQAERWGLVQRNVAKLASPPAQPQREQHPPSPAEVRGLLAAATELRPGFGLFVRVMVATGARRAEVCGLRWSDVDLDEDTLEVSRSYLWIPGASGDRPTKSRSARTISLDPDTIAALATGWAEAADVARMCGLDAATRRTGYIFADDGLGQVPWRPDLTNVWWSKTRVAAGVSSTIRMHDLRHFQATQLLDAGVPVPTVAARLGHADGTTTVKIYAHRTARADAFAADIVGRLLADED